MLDAGGKRIRPAYCHWGWVAAGGDPSSSEPLDAGAALELLHAFALAHDDVMDGSPTRRGAPTVWIQFVERHQAGQWQGESRRFGEAAAILVGNIALVLADRTIGPIDAAPRAIWDQLRIELNIGQFLDVLGSARGNVSSAGARVIMRHKTAGYTVVRPLQLGAALAGRPDLAPALKAHGEPVGTAFQLRDDVLGVFGDTDLTGKPVGDDLREGKPTVLLALANERANPQQREILSRVARLDDNRQIADIQQIIVDTGALASVEIEIGELMEAATVALGQLEIPEMAKSALGHLAEFVVERSS